VEDMNNVSITGHGSILSGKTNKKRAADGATPATRWSDVVMNRKYYNESEWKSKDIKLFYLMTGMMGIFLGVMLFAIAVLLWSPAAR
jgi:hypothetical protein